MIRENGSNELVDSPTKSPPSSMINPDQSLSPRRNGLITKLVSIVIPMLNEKDNAVALATRMAQIVFENPDYKFEFVAVDDGSTDDTAEALRNALDPIVALRLISLSRNFGAHSALTAGFQIATGDCVLMLGADLQEPSSLVPQMIASWEAGADIVWATRSERAVDSKASRLFWKMIRHYSEIKRFPEEAPSTALCDRVVVDELNMLTERNRNFILLMSWVGFKQVTVEFVQVARNAGESKWSTKSLIKLAIDSLAQFSSAPIRGMSYLGIGSALVGFIYAAYLVIRAILVGEAPAGWTTVVVIVLLMGGIQLIMLGVLGEYIWRGVAETRGRPHYVIDRRSSWTTKAFDASLPEADYRGIDVDGVPFERRVSLDRRGTPTAM